MRKGSNKEYLQGRRWGSPLIGGLRKKASKGEDRNRKPLNRICARTKRGLMEESVKGKRPTVEPPETALLKAAKKSKQRKVETKMGEAGGGQAKKPLNFLSR